MRGDDLLASWMLWHALDVPARASRELGRRLDDLEGLLSAPASGRPLDFWQIGLSVDARSGAILPPELRLRAEGLYRELFESAGNGKHALEQALLALIGYTALPESVPFLREMLSLSRPRDTFAGDRRRLAAAGLAHIGVHRGDCAAMAALHDMAEHGSPEARADAVAALGAALLAGRGPGDPATIAVLSGVARGDRVFAPRFLARRALFVLGAELPPSARDEILTIEAKYASAVRAIELRATATLDDLAAAILRALGWDDDHLFAFHMTRDVRDRRFLLDPSEDEVLDEDAPDFAAIELGQLGLVAGHRFLFRYDFGDDHRVALTARAVGGVAQPKAKYPRETERKGAAPPQYGW